MRGEMMRKSSVWAFLLAMFLAVGAAVAILPGCGDDDLDPVHSDPRAVVQQ